jgi:hypothetical protein
MRFLLFLLVLCCFFSVFAWPVALVLLVLSPLILLVAIPFGILGLVLRAMFALLEALLMAPARIMGYRPRY